MDGWNEINLLVLKSNKENEKEKKNHERLRYQNSIEPSTRLASQHQPNNDEVATILSCYKRKSVCCSSTDLVCVCVYVFLYYLRLNILPSMINWL